VSWGQRGRAGPQVFGCHVVDGVATVAARARSTAPLLPAGLHLLVNIRAEVEQTLWGCRDQESGEEGGRMDIEGEKERKEGHNEDWMNGQK